MKKIAILVSGGGTNLQALLNAVDGGIITNGQITAVISSSPTAYALKRAENAGVKTYIVDRKKYNSNREMTLDLVKLLKEIDIDLIVLAGFMYVLTEELVSEYKNAIINVHPALIPSFCGEGYYGLNVHKKALEYGVKVTGATVHFVSEECDGGPIILQKAVYVQENDTPQVLQKRVMEEAEWQILPKAVNLFCNDKLHVEGRIVHISD